MPYIRITVQIDVSVISCSLIPWLYMQNSLLTAWNPPLSLFFVSDMMNIINKQNKRSSSDSQLRRHRSLWETFAASLHCFKTPTVETETSQSQHTPPLPLACGSPPCMLRSVKDTRVQGRTPQPTAVLLRVEEGSTEKHMQEKGTCSK